MPENGRVILRVLNLMGQEIAVLMKNDLLKGYYSISWNGKKTSGHDVPTGIYIYQIVTPNFSEVKKMMILR